MPTSIIIADDHPLVLKGLYDFLLEKGYNVLGGAEDGRKALDLIKQLHPDIAILDIKMPFLTGLEVAKCCQNLGLPTKIVLITFEKDLAIYNEAKSLNAYGYVLKEFALAEIEKCIHSVIEGRPYFSEDLLDHLEIKQVPKSFELLTPTEIEILKLIAKNNTGIEIGELMHISSRTVEKHKSNIIKKLDLPPKQNSLLIWAKENQEFLL